MAVLQDPRYQEIAQWVTANDTHRSAGLAWKYRLRDAGFTVAELQSYGSAFTHDAYVLDVLINDGKVNDREANAFLAQKYPDLKYGGGRFGDVQGGLAAETAIAASSKPSSDPERKTIAQTARDQQVQAGIGSFQSNPAFAQPTQYSVRPPKVPVNYDAKLMGETLRGMADDVSLALTSLAGGNVRFQPNTIPGYAIQPGSLSAAKLDPIDVARYYRDLPGPQDAILLRLVPDYGTDREFDAGAGLKGPGRVWRVTTAQYPPKFTPTPGPQRFRLVFKDLRLGVMSLQQGAGRQAGDVSVRYGLVIRDIPHYLQRIPSAILYCGFVGHAPCSLVADNISVNIGAANVTKLFHGTGTTAGRAYEAFVTNASLAFEPYGAGQLAPTAAELASVEGINFMVISGRDAEEVYGQMNSAFSNNYARINGDARGPNASCPNGTFPDSPFPANFSRRSGANNISDLETTAMTTLAVSQQWLEGVPMSFDACQRLRATENFMSIVVQAAFSKTIPWAYYAGGGNVEGPSVWDTLGIRTTETNGRDLEVDVVVI